MKELLVTGVSISLVYNETADALIGRIKDFAVAVRENNETMSYGCLIWAKKGELAAVTDAESYLAEQVTKRSDLVKHFKVTERGIAVALVKTNDPYANITNIKRFLIDLVNSLSTNSYSSCCYDCGNTTGLGIYGTAGTVVQACAKCAEKNADKYSLLMDLTDTSMIPSASTPVRIPDVPTTVISEAPMTQPSVEPAPAPAPAPAPIPTPVPAAPVAETLAAPIAAAVADSAANIAAPAEAAPEKAPEKSEEDKHDFSEFLTEVGASSGAPVVESAFEKVEISSDDNVSINELFAEKTEEPAEPQPAQQPTFRTKMMSDEEYKSEFAALIADESDKDEQPAFVPKTEEQQATEAAEFAALLDEMKPDGENIVDEEKERLEAENKAAEGADYTGFMYNEGDNAEKEDPWKEERQKVIKPVGALSEEEKVSNSSLVISELEADKVGMGELSVPEQEQEVVGHDANVAVTEIVDDSDEGEDVNIEELESTINKPTETGGKKLEARETPLEEDGSVPLVNPTSEYADIKPSPVNGPDAVQPLESRERIRAVTDEEELRAVPIGYADEDPRADRSDPYRGEPPTPVAVPPSFMAQRVSRISFGSDPVFGIIGAIVLGAVGVALWIFLSSAVGGIGGGYSGRRVRSLILSLATFAISIGVFGGYYIGGEEMDMKGVIISSVINVIYDVLGVLGKYVISVQSSIEKVFGFHISLADASDWVTYKFAEGSVSFLIDFWANVIVMIVMLVGFIRYCYKKL